jgi:predicted MFS family arabinose efflux permease
MGIASAIGPVLGGMIIAAAGPGAAFGLNAVSYLAVMYVLLRYPDVRRASERGRLRRPVESFGGAMITAVRHAYGSPPLRALYTCAAVFAVSAASVPALLPVLAKGTLHTSEAGYGILLGGLGSGAVVGAMVLRRVRDTVRARTIVATSMALYGLSVTALTLRPSLPMATALLVPAGIGWICSLSSVNALVQLTAPPPLRARALALYQLAFYASWSVGASLGGAIAHHVGIAGTMRLAALGTVVAAAITTLLPLPSFADGAGAVERSAIRVR